MDSRTPCFAVVGHPNKGKSSIVSAISRNESVSVGKDPGTTKTNSVFEIRLEGDLLFSLIDTPGFQRSRKFLRKLREHESGSEGRREAIEHLLAQPEIAKEFPDEVELLKPIIDGAGVLYVVDGSVPYGSEFDPELEILRWTGQPRMALINQIGEADFVDDWKNALGQFFSIVRVFDAHDGDFNKQINLLRGFSQLDETWQDSLERAASALELDRRRVDEQAADSISRMLVKSIQLKLSDSLSGEGSESVTQGLEKEFRSLIMAFEENSRNEIQSLYRYELLQTDSENLGELDSGDLFSAETWRVFGLSKKDLLKWSAVGGAAVGGGLDVLSGGTSLMMGTLLGAAIGAGGSLFAADKLVDSRIMMLPLGERVVEVGPLKNLSLPHILLRRALIHWRAIRERSHADRSLLNLDEKALRDLSENLLEEKDKKSFEKIFRALRKSSEGLQPMPLSGKDASLVSKVLPKQQTSSHYKVASKNLDYQDKLSKLISKTLSD